MHCYVYKSLKHQDMYLYLPNENDFSDVPESLLERFGRSDFVLAFDLSGREQLGREKPEQVLYNLTHFGYHLQLPALDNAERSGTH